MTLRGQVIAAIVTALVTAVVILCSAKTRRIFLDALKPSRRRR